VSSPVDRQLLDTVDVAKNFVTSGQTTRAVAGVDFELAPGRSAGIAGESGSGKTTLLRLLLGIEKPTSGTVRFRGRDIASLDRAGRREYRRNVQAVFQDPGASFDPRARIWRTITEPVWMASGLSRRQRKSTAVDLLRSVDLPARFADRHPHELSGGERQRVAIARALSSHPAVVVLDEPVTALDVSVRGSIINLLLDRADAATYVVVSHDLTVIHHLADDLFIMFKGIVVERGPVGDLLESPKHPYTQLLVSSVANPLYQPPIDRDDPAPIAACPYLHRCPEAMPVCSTLPGPTAVDGHIVRCHLYPDTSPPASVPVSIRPPSNLEVPS
jgi:oligopeptide/dipeptide ABC transporter ATP-binding protein